MTPLELLEDVKSRFIYLLHDDDEALKSLLKKALVKYQELAGFTDKIRLNQKDYSQEGTFLLPQNFLARLALKDSTGRTVSHQVWGQSLEVNADYFSFPLTLEYLANVSSVGWEEYQLPLNSISLLSEYLEVLIEIPNSERKRMIAVAGKLDIAAIPDEATLSTRKAELEASMRLNRAIVPPLSFI